MSTFGLLHTFGSFNGTLGSQMLTLVVLLLGVAFSLIIQRTHIIWGAVAGHFFAGLSRMPGYFAVRGS